MRLRGIARVAVACAMAGGATAGTLAAGTATASASTSYGRGAVYQVEISGNAPDASFWVWAALYDEGGVQTADYEETDCIHLPHVATAAANDAGDATWSIKDGMLYLSGVKIVRNAATANFEVPLPPNGVTGHSSGLTVVVQNEVPGGPPLKAAYIYPAGTESQNQIAP